MPATNGNLVIHTYIQPRSRQRGESIRGVFVLVAAGNKNNKKIAVLARAIFNQNKLLICFDFSLLFLQFL